MKIKAIIFDLDNTLIDFMRMKQAAVNGAISAMRDSGLEISHKKVLRLFIVQY